MDNKNTNSNAYLETKVLTASPEQLQLMLYDGAIRFCEQARAAIEAHEIENSFNLINKAERIVMEMCNSMREDLAPETCANMRRLYIFCYDRLVTANVKKDSKLLDEALEILCELRETWVLLMEKLQEERCQELAAPDESSGKTPDQFGATVNFEG